MKKVFWAVVMLVLVWGCCGGVEFLSDGLVAFVDGLRLPMETRLCAADPDICRSLAGK